MSGVRSDGAVLLLGGPDVDDLLLVTRYVRDRAAEHSALGGAAARLRAVAKAQGAPVLDPEGRPVGG